MDEELSHGEFILLLLAVCGCMGITHFLNWWSAYCILGIFSAVLALAYTKLGYDCTGDDESSNSGIIGSVVVPVLAVLVVVVCGPVSLYIVVKDYWNIDTSEQFLFS